MTICTCGAGLPDVCFISLFTLNLIKLELSFAGVQFFVICSKPENIGFLLSICKQCSVNLFIYMNSYSYITPSIFNIKERIFQNILGKYLFNAKI